MRRLMRIGLAGCLATMLIFGQVCLGFAQDDSAYSPSSAGASHLDMSGYTADQTRSASLTDYLKNHKLPLVGAQVLKDSSGGRAVVLYGYTGSEFGKSDAASKTRKFLHDSTITVDNRIKVRPELLASNRAAAPVAPDESADSSAGRADNYGSPDANSYAAQGNQAQQYAQHQNTGSMISSAAPLLMLGMMALSAFSGGSFQIGPGGGMMGGGMGSPFGPPQPYNQYPGYPTMPPASPYGGSSPYGP